MGSRITLGILIGSSITTIFAIIVTIVRYLNNSTYYVSLVIAVLMVILGIYSFVLRRLDGPSFVHSLEDERLLQISHRARSYAFWFLFICVWSFAVVMEFFDPIINQKHFSLILAGIGTVAFFINMVCFVWQKYRVYD